MSSYSTAKKQKSLEAMLATVKKHLTHSSLTSYYASVEQVTYNTCKNSLSQLQGKHISIRITMDSKPTCLITATSQVHTHSYHSSTDVR